MEQTLREHTKAFRVIMWVRIWYGGLRIILGLSLLKFVGLPFSDLFQMLMSHELIEGHNDFLYNVFTPVAGNIHYNVTFFVASYLLFWGIVDIFLSLQLLAHRLWAYPLSLILISSFMGYEIVRLFHHPTVALAIVICYDVIALWFIWREYRRVEIRTL